LGPIPNPQSPIPKLINNTINLNIKNNYYYFITFKLL